MLTNPPDRMDLSLGTVNIRQLGNAYYRVEGLPIKLHK